MTEASRNWLITGAGSGLGLEIVRAAAAAGHRVAGSVRDEASAARLRQAAPEALAIILDLADGDAPERLVAEALSALGSLDVVVNNAGRGFTAAIEEASDDEAKAVFDLNFFVPLRVIRAILPAMRAQGSGHIINVTSISGFKPWSGTGIYCASKFALEGLGQTLAQEVAEFGIKVTNVQPGGLRTGFNGRSLGASERMIDAYADGAHFARHALARSDGRQPGDPARAALAVVEIARAGTPPLNLLLGNDAVAMANHRIAQLLGDMGSWAPTSTGIGFAE